jgi:23S rRNA (cytidine2498-2'-O)-methyltransferase
MKRQAGRLRATSSACFWFDAAGRGGTFAGMLLTCQAGFETLLGKELGADGGAVAEQGPGWIRVTIERPTESLAFPHLTLKGAVEVKGDSVNGLAQQVADFFLTNLRGERIDTTWPCVWLGPAEMVGLGRRISAVEAAFRELLKKKLSRVAKLAIDERPRGVGLARGLFVFFTDFGRVFVAREAWCHGQQRMADDDLAPSRSYLKVEEAYVVLGREPRAGETVCDLGAAPGGWSYSAAKRGARVVAIDNGPLKGGALNHSRIEHRREDAFRFVPDSGLRFDWLFCDLVEEPHHVLQHIVSPWMEHGWCGAFVVNLKFGRVDPIGLLAELRSPNSPLLLTPTHFGIRHLYHDREEFTVVGERRFG